MGVGGARGRLCFYVVLVVYHGYLCVYVGVGGVRGYVLRIYVGVDGRLVCLRGGHPTSTQSQNGTFCTYPDQFVPDLPQ